MKGLPGSISNKRRRSAPKGTGSPVKNELKINATKQYNDVVNNRCPDGYRMTNTGSCTPSGGGSGGRPDDPFMDEYFTWDWFSKPWEQQDEGVYGDTDGCLHAPTWDQYFRDGIEFTCWNWTCGSCCGDMDWNDPRCDCPAEDLYKSPITIFDMCPSGTIAGRTGNCGEDVDPAYKCMVCEPLCHQGFDNIPETGKPPEECWVEGQQWSGFHDCSWIMQAWINFAEAQYNNRMGGNAQWGSWRRTNECINWQTGEPWGIGWIRYKGSADCFPEYIKGCPNPNDAYYDINYQIPDCTKCEDPSCCFIWNGECRSWNVQNEPEYGCDSLSLTQCMMSESCEMCIDYPSYVCRPLGYTDEDGYCLGSYKPGDQDTAQIFGCTDELACNYNPQVTDDDGSCCNCNCECDTAGNVIPVTNANDCSFNGINGQRCQWIGQTEDVGYCMEFITGKKWDCVWDEWNDYDCHCTCTNGDNYDGDGNTIGECHNFDGHGDRDCRQPCIDWCEDKNPDAWSDRPDDPDSGDHRRGGKIRKRRN